MINFISVNYNPDVAWLISSTSSAYLPSPPRPDRAGGTCNGRNILSFCSLDDNAKPDDNRPARPVLGGCGATLPPVARLRVLAGRNRQEPARERMLSGHEGIGVHSPTEVFSPVHSKKHFPHGPIFNGC